MIAVSADLHLGHCLRKSIKELKNDSYVFLQMFLDKLLQLRRQYNITSLVLAGDIFDKRTIDGKALKNFTNFIDQLHQVGIKTYTIQGNHDKGEISIPDIEGGYNLHDTLLEIDGHTLFGLDSMSAEDLKEKLTTVPKCDFLVLHAPFQHLLGFEGAYDISLEDIPKQAKNVLVGDVHTVDITKFKHKDGYCLSPGALFPCNISQGNNHGFYLIGGKEPEFVRLDVRKVFIHKIYTKKDIDPIRKILKDNMNEQMKPVAELRYPVDMMESVNKLKTDFISKYILLDKVCSNLDGVNSLAELDEVYDKATLSELLKFAIDGEKEPEVFTFLKELLDSDSPGEIIETKLEEYAVT